MAKGLRISDSSGWTATTLVMKDSADLTRDSG